MSDPELPDSEGRPAADQPAPQTPPAPPVPPAPSQVGAHEPPAYDAAPAGYPQLPDQPAGVGFPQTNSYPNLTGGLSAGAPAAADYPTNPAYPPHQGYPGQQQGYPTGAHYPAPPAPRGRTLSIVGFVLAIVVAPIGLILSIIALIQLNRSKGPKGLAVAGIIIGAVLTLVMIAVTIMLVGLFSHIFAVCAEYGPGVWNLEGVTYTCS